jgi:serine/threonine-protein phosphatase 2A regulatory subunit B
VFEKTLKIVQETPLHQDGIMLRPSLPTSNNLGNSPTAAGNLRLPKLTHHDTIIAAVPRKIYANGMTLSFFFYFVDGYASFTDNTVSH